MREAKNYTTAGVAPEIKNTGRVFFKNPCAAVWLTFYAGALFCSIITSNPKRFKMEEHAWKISPTCTDARP